MKYMILSMIIMIATNAFADTVGDKQLTAKAYVDATLGTKQDKIPAAGKPGVAAGNSVLTYTPGGNGVIGERGIYSNTNVYNANTDGDKLITASALNNAFNSLPTVETSTMVCANYPTCTLWTITDDTAYGSDTNATACNPGYHFDVNNKCVGCQDNHYCTGDGTMQACPEFTYNSTEELKSAVVGYNAHSVESARVYSPWLYSGREMTGITKCPLELMNVEVDQGKMLYYILGHSQQTGTYSRKVLEIWARANNGYYLSNFYSNSWHGIKSCTNAPANAHYTGPGTPDSSTVTNANDCPWVCDDGYSGSSAAGSSSCTPN